PRASSDRIALYKIFAKLFSSIAIRVPQETPLSAWEQRAAANLGALAPLPRQAFLLVAVEGFKDSEAAEILDVDENEFAALLAKASNEISRQVATDVMIIEDEPLIAMDIEEMVESLGHRVVGTARTHTEATALFQRTHPKMVLADIQLADGSSGIDAVNEILASTPVPVIFITAFPERLLTGERPEPAFLVTKPFNPDMVKALISQALFFDRQAKAAA
ncbi:MAG: response regulator, partial [Rhizobiaceae bacterium]|nr:response regulator [Rhizobiaceae bacterium]